MSSYHSYKDEELTTAVNQADFGAYAELVDRKKGELYRISSALTRVHIRAEQLLQDTIAAVWYECRKNKDQEMDVSLLFMQTLLVLDKKRQGKSRQNLSSIEATSGESLPVKQMISQQSKQIEQAIDRMPASVRQVFLLTYLAEKNSSEIASYIGKTEKRVTRYLQQAMTIIAKEIGENSGDMLSSILRKHFEGEREQIEIDLRAGKGEAAVQQGLTEARKERSVNQHSNRRVYQWSFIGAMLIIVSAAMLYMFTDSRSPADIHHLLNTEGTLVTPDMSYWKSTIKKESGLKKRLNEEDYLPIGKVLPENNGLRLIIDGAMDTSTGFILWYTLENVEGTQAPLLENGLIRNRSNENSIGSGDSGEEGIHYLTKGNKTQGRLTLSLSNKARTDVLAVEKEVFITANADDERFRYAEFMMEPPVFPEKPKKTMEVNEYFTIQEQEYHIKYISLSTQNTRVRIEAVGAKNQSEADEAVERLIEPSLYVVNKSVLGMEGGLHSLLESYGSDLIFESIYYEDYTELSLQVEGFKKLEGDYATFIIDSDTGQVMHSDRKLPKGMRISTVEDKEILYLHYPIENSEQYGIYQIFTDREGGSYEISGAIKKKDEILYKLPNATYIQPLTFRFYEKNIDESQLNQKEEGPSAHHRLTIPMVKK
ncbi:RNA polymerase sigma factor [Paenibacillus sp. An7]|uniref:RNA polymerase sigma factor n=1 Tax=Paenibacillus sp. An7 TaxID=2689577 RepID=UPI001357E358|nr:RNA polymerase sigma factor [Paenibacillus sp. An7]